MFDFTSQEFIQSLPYWGYPAMFALMIIEGPVVTIVAAFLASMGYFNVYAVLALSVISDTIGDLIWYFAGRLGGRRVLDFVAKFFKKSGVAIAEMEKAFELRGARIIFFVKATTGLCLITFVLAGISRMKISKFLLFSFVGGLFWSTLMVLLGYFLGYASDQISKYIEYAGYLISGMITVVVVGFIVFRRWHTNRIIEK